MIDRRTLRLTTALATVLAAAGAMPAAAQTLPSVGDPGGATISTDTATNAMTVDLNNANRIIKWNSFSIGGGAGESVSFRTADAATAYAVLNRVTTATPSTIDGALQAQSNIAVWLVNDAGITFGPTGRFSGGSLVLSTLDLDDASESTFLAGGGVRVAGTSRAAIGLQAGTGTIISSSGILAIAQQLSVNKTMTATGDIALIAASDVTLPASLGSPLSFTINAGTTLASIVGGKLTGASVKLAGASQGGAIANLLGVDGGATLTATSTDGVVVLATATAAGTGVTVASPAGVDGIVSAGALATLGANGSVRLTATGAVSQTGAIDSGRDLIVRGRDVTLGGATAVTQRAAGTVDVTATGGAITGGAGLTLTANADGLGSEPLVLDATGGAIAFAVGSTLNAGNARQSAIGIRLNGAPQPLALGNVNARRLGEVSADRQTFTSGFAFAGNAADITLGNVSLIDTLTIAAGGSITTGSIDITGAGSRLDLRAEPATGDIIANGAVRAAGAVTLTAGRDVLAPSVTATDGDIAIAVGRTLAGPGAARADLTADGVTRDIRVTAGEARLGRVSAGRDIRINATTALDVASGQAARGDIVIDLAADANAAIGDQTAGRSIAVRTAGTGSIAGGTLIAGEDIAVLAGGAGSVTLARAQADDDVDVTAAGGITIGTVAARGLGGFIDARSIALGGALPAFTVGESAGRTGSGVRLTNTAGAGGITLSGGSAANDIVIDARLDAAVGDLTAGNSVAIRSGGATTGGALVAGEDIAVAAGSAATIGSARAGDDIGIAAAAGTLALGNGATTGAANVDARRVDLAAATIGFAAGEQTPGSGATITLGAAAGDVVAGSTGAVSARDALNVTARTGAATTGNIRLGTLASTARGVVVDADRDVTGLAGASTGTSDTGFGRGAISAATAVGVTAGGLVQLGALTAGSDVSVVAGSAAPARNGAIDIQSATATTGALTLTARAVGPIADTVRDGDVLLGRGNAGTMATLSNVATGGTAGAIEIRDAVSAAGNIRIDSAGDVRVAEYSATTPATGFIDSAGGNIAVTAAGSVYGLTGPAAVPVGATPGVLEAIAGGNLDVSATGDVRADLFRAGGTLSLNVGGALTGGGPGSVDRTLSGGALFARGTGGTITVTAGGATGIARFNSVVADAAVAITANTIAIGTVQSLAGTVTLNGSQTIGAGLYLGRIQVPGNLTVQLGGTPSANALVTTTDLFDPTYRRTSLIATTGPVTATVGREAQLGTVSAATSVTVNARALTATSATATGGALALTATTGTLALGTGVAGTTATLIKQAGAVATAGDELRVTDRLTAGGATTLTSSTGARIASATAGGDLTVTATTGSVTGVAGGAAAGDAPLLPGFGRADLIATAAGTKVTVSAAETAQLGTVNAGTAVAGTLGTLGATPSDQLRVDAKAIDVRLATAANNRLALVATSGDARLGVGTSAGSAEVRAGANARIGALTARAGEIRVTASAGDMTGLAGGAAAGDTPLLPSFGRASLSAAGSDGLVTVAATAGTAQLGAVVAGTGTTVSTATTDQLRVDARAIDATSAIAANGRLALAATAGDVRLGAGQSGTTSDIRAAANVRIGTLTARTGDIAVTATAGDVTGLAGAAAAGDTPLLPGFGRASLQAATVDRRVTVAAAAGTAQLGTITAGSGTTVNAATTDQLRVDARAIDATSATAANGRLALAATAGSLTVGPATAGSTATLTSSGNARVGPATSGGAFVLDAGGSAQVGTLASGGATTITARGGALTLGNATSVGDVTLSSTGLATLGTLAAAGRRVSLTAADADIGGAVTAQRIEMVDRSAANALRLGDGLAAGPGFALSATEVNRLNAPQLLFDAGTTGGATAQDVAIGTLALDADSGAASLDIYGTRRIDLTGLLSTPGGAASRTIRIGGSTADSAQASVIRIQTQAADSQRIDIGDAALELRGARIGAGQDAGFLQSIGLTAGGTPIDADAVATRYIGNAASSLYNAGLAGGTAYTATQPIVTARTLTVRFSDYALFQNTSNTGLSSGVTLGANPATPALRLIGPNPPDARAFALFGTINGAVETGAALLGPTIIAVTAVDRPNARINGCVIGSGGGGCIVNLVAQPAIGIFDPSRTDPFRAGDSFRAPFNPLVGTNNESLFGDVGTFGLSDLPLLPDCPPGDTTCKPQPAPQPDPQPKRQDQ